MNIDENLHSNDAMSVYVCFSPFNGESQVLHLWVLLFDLFGEVNDDFLKLRNQSGLSQTDVVVQRRCLFISEKKNKRGFIISFCVADMFIVVFSVVSFFYIRIWHVKW